MNTLTFESTRQQWRGECSDVDGHTVTVSIDATTDNEMAINRWQKHCQDATAVFGRWHYQYQGQTQELTFFPIALYGCDWVQYLRLNYSFTEKQS